MSTDIVNIECEINIDDVIAWNYYYMENNPVLKRKLKPISLVYMPISVLLFIIGIISFALELEVLYGVVCCTIGAVCFLYFLFYLQLMRRNIRKNVKEMYSQGENSTIGVHKYSISLEGVRDITKVHENTTKWHVVENIAETVEHLFINIRPNSAFIIPKRAFPDDTVFNRIFHDINSMFQKSQKQN